MDPPGRRINLSNLAIQVVLDHAGGHGTLEKRQCCGQPFDYEKCHINTRSTIPSLTSSRSVKEGDGFYPSPSSTPTRTHKQKKYILLHRPDEVSRDDDCPEGKQYRVAIADRGQHLSPQRSIAPDSPIGTPTVHRRRFSLEPTFLPRPRNNEPEFSSQRHDRTSNGHTTTTSAAAAAAGTTTTTTTTAATNGYEDVVSSVRSRPRSVSLLALRRMVVPSTPSPQEPEHHHRQHHQQQLSERRRRKRWSIDLATTKPSNGSPKKHHRYNSGEMRNHLLAVKDSPTASYKWPPRGYRALIESRETAPDIFSVTSSSTNSTQTTKKELS